MKKLFTFFTLLSLFGIFGANAINVTVKFTGVENAAEGVKVVLATSAYKMAGSYFVNIENNEAVINDFTPGNDVLIQPLTGYTIKTASSDPASFSGQFVKLQNGQQTNYNNNLSSTLGITFTPDAWIMQGAPDGDITLNVTLEAPENMVTIQFIGSGLEYSPFEYVYQGTSTSSTVGGRTNLSSNVITSFLTNSDLTYYFTPISGKTFGNITISYKDGNGTVTQKQEGNWYVFTIPNVKSNYGVQITIEIADNVKNRKYIDWTLPENTSNPFIISSLVFLGNETQINSLSALETYYLDFGSVTYDSNLKINFAKKSNGSAEYEVGSVSASYVSGGKTIEISAAKINVYDTYAEVEIPYVADMSDLSITVKLADQGISVTLNVNIENSLVVTDQSGEQVTLEGKSTQIDLPMNGTLKIAAKDGFAITNAVYGTGKSIALSADETYYMADELEEGTVLDITVTAVTPPDQYEDAFTIWFNPADAADFQKVIVYKGEGNIAYQAEGSVESVEIPFDASEGDQFQVWVYTNTNTENVYSYFNGIYRGETPMQYTHTVYNGVPTDGSELKLYITEPETYTVNFTGELSADETTVQVLANGLSLLTGWSATNPQPAYLALAGTYFTLTMPADYVLAVNGDTIDPTSTGDNGASYNYTLNASNASNADVDFAFVITGVVGIDSIQNAISGEDVIYNLQGVRVNKANLSKGLYIINGKKVLVK